MAGRTSTTKDGAMKKGVSYWQENWMTKVLSNGYNSQAKLVFLRIASFGERGCWMNNETISDEFNRSDRTVRRAVSELWSKGDIIITGWNGHGRTMYAASHPKVAPEIRRRFIEQKQKGKISSKEEYYAKIRFREREKTESEEAQKPAIEVEYVRKKDMKEYLRQAMAARKSKENTPK